MHNIYESKEFRINDLSDHITERDKFVAGKQFLIGIAVVFLLSLIAYVLRPEEGRILIEICRDTLPPLATLIIGFYFRERIS